VPLENGAEPFAGCYPEWLLKNSMFIKTAKIWRIAKIASVGWMAKMTEPRGGAKEELTCTPDTAAKSASTAPNFHPNGWAEDPRLTQDPMWC
jgi:hypothetical protein